MRTCPGLSRELRGARRGRRSCLSTFPRGQCRLDLEGSSRRVYVGSAACGGPGVLSVPANRALGGAARDTVPLSRSGAEINIRRPYV